MITKGLPAALLASLLLAGCVTEQGTPPVIDAGSRLPGSQLPPRSSQNAPTAPVTAPLPPARETPPPAVVETFPAPSNGDGFTRGVPVISGQESSAANGAAGSGLSNPLPPATPSGIPGQVVLMDDEKLDGPLLALLSTAREQQGSGNLSGAAASLERAQRIAPREPQVLYRLAEVRLAQGDAEQAEQVAQRALSYTGSRPPLQAALWDLIARAREQRGDLTGAAQARAMARVNL